jgi:hypothetical protein
MFTYPYQIVKKLALDSIAELKEVDWYLEQDSITDKSTWIYTSPILFLEFIPIGDMQFYSNRSQSQEVDIAAHLLTGNVLDNDKRMKKDSPVDHMRVWDKINRNFLGFSAKLSYLPEFAALADTPNDQAMLTSLNRITAPVPPHRIKRSLMKSIQYFRCIVYDHSGCKAYGKPSPAPALEVTVEIDEQG